MVNKKAYFQGGGGANEPAKPGQKKYKVDPAILVQPRFEEPFYRNYDLYDCEGIDGPPQYGPGSGWNHIMEHKSIKEFLDFRRQRLRGKYKADDFWIEDTEANRKQRVAKMKVRAQVFDRIIKTAQRNYDMGKGLYENMDKYKSVEDFRNDENHIDFETDAEIGSGSIQGTNETYEKPMALGPAVNSDNSSFPEAVGLGEQESYTSSVPFGGQESGPTPLEDADGKPASSLDFGHDLTDGEEMPKGLTEEDLEKLTKKYLTPHEPSLFGLPDGISPPEDVDPDATVNEPNPEYGETESGSTMYQDKWNI